MLVTKQVEMKWNSRNKKRFVELGYTFTKMQDSFYVNVNHLSDGSNVNVDVECDFCGKIISKPWYRYINENKICDIHKDCCNDCKKYKIEETCIDKYGVKSIFAEQNMKEKIKETNMQKYGSENVFSSEQIKKKIYATNIKKYGVGNPTQNKDIQNKISKTCMERYNVPYFICTQRMIGESNPKWKGGYKYHRQERSTFEYNQWRKSVFIKDKFTCQCCQRKNHKGNGKSITLNAHHILNWKDNPVSRYDVSNGVTLCKECHLLFHSLYGKKNNTKSQFEEFIFNNGKKVC